MIEISKMKFSISEVFRDRGLQFGGQHGRDLQLEVSVACCENIMAIIFDRVKGERVKTFRFCLDCILYRKFSLDPMQI